MNRRFAKPLELILLIVDRLIYLRGEGKRDEFRLSDLGLPLPAGRTSVHLRVCKAHGPRVSIWVLFSLTLPNAPRAG